MSTEIYKYCCAFGGKMGIIRNKEELKCLQNSNICEFYATFTFFQARTNQIVCLQTKQLNDLIGLGWC